MSSRERISDLSIDRVPIKIGPAGGMNLRNFAHDRFVLGLRGAEDLVRQSLADRRAVRRNRHDAQPIDAMQFAGGVGGRARHAGQMRIAEEIILNRHAGRMAGVDRDLDAFLGFDGLMQAVAPFAPFRHAAGEFVDDHDLAVADDIMPIEQKRPLGPQARVR